MRSFAAWSVLLILGACGIQTTQGPRNTPMTPTIHTPFVITSGPHQVDCNVCHGSYNSFKEFTCLQCHGHEDEVLTQQLHLGVSTYAYASTACYGCHASGARQPFDHAGIATGSSTDCASCHQVGADFAALPLAGFNHQKIVSDCGECHSTKTWLGATGAPPVLKADPSRTITVDAGIPTYGGYSIAAINPTAEFLPMSMDHLSGEIPTAANSACTNCHASTSVYLPGNFHGSLAKLGLAQPTACVDCHASSMPTGFVGPTATSPVRTPSSAEMMHDALVWSGGARGTTPLVTAECGACHVTPAQQTVAWSTDRSGSTPATFHPALTAAGSSQPGSCFDCHANSQPPADASQRRVTDSTTLTSASNDATTGVPAGTHDQIDHVDSNVTQHDCNLCHSQVGFSNLPGVQGREWAQAKFHESFTSANPLIVNGSTGRCSHCHMNLRPVASFPAFDHGALSDVAGTQDCAACHSWPGTGSPSAPNWLGATTVPQCLNTGAFAIPNPPAPAPRTQAAIPACLPHPTVGSTSCSACHANGLGGKSAIGYDHASSVMDGQCNACHEAGSNLVGTVWNGSTNSPGAGDTRPYTLTYNRHGVGPIANHFYPVDCWECHSPPGGIATATSGQSYLNLWSFPHQQNTDDRQRMSYPSTCLLCHTNGIPDN